MDFFIALYNYQISLLAWQTNLREIFLANMHAASEMRVRGHDVSKSQPQIVGFPPSSSILCKYIIEVSWIQECTLCSATTLTCTVQTVSARTRTCCHLGACVCVRALCELKSNTVNHSYHIVYEMSSKMNLMCAQFRNSFPIPVPHSVPCVSVCVYSMSACSMFNLNNH